MKTWSTPASLPFKGQATKTPTINGLLIRLGSLIPSFDIGLKLSFFLFDYFSQPRSVSEDIRNCKHWKFETSDDPHFADVHVKMHNEVGPFFSHCL